MVTKSVSLCHGTLSKFNLIDGCLSKSSHLFSLYPSSQLSFLPTFFFICWSHHPLSFFFPRATHESTCSAWKGTCFRRGFVFITSHFYSFREAQWRPIGSSRSKTTFPIVLHSKGVIGMRWVVCSCCVSSRTLLGPPSCLKQIPQWH